MSMFSIYLAALAISAVIPTLAPAQSHSHAANGGQTQQIGSYEVELVVKGYEARLYVLDANERPAKISEFSASAEVLTEDSATKNVQFSPGQGDFLASSVDFPFRDKFRAAITLKHNGIEVGKGRYNLTVKNVERIRR